MREPVRRPIPEKYRRQSLEDLAKEKVLPDVLRETDDVLEGLEAGLDARPSLRKPVRDESPRARAARRAAELRSHGGTEVEAGSEFYFPVDAIPDGWSYEWKRHSFLGKEDPAYEVALARSGWEPVPADRHPEQMPAGSAGKTITRKGMVLMERPLEITEEARRRDQLKALNQVRAKEEQLHSAPPGTFERGGHSQVRPKINKSYSPTQIPPNDG